MTHNHDEVSEAQMLVEQLSGRKLKSRAELKDELERMVAASKEPGYDPDRADVMHKKRELVISTMETALAMLGEEAIESVEAQPEPVRERAEPTPVKPTESRPSAFTASAAEAPKATTEPTKPKTFMESVSGAFAYVRDSITGFFRQKPDGKPSDASQAWEKTKDLFVEAGGKVMAFFAGIGTWVSELFTKTPAPNATQPNQPPANPPGAAPNTPPAAPPAGAPTQPPANPPGAAPNTPPAAPPAGAPTQPPANPPAAAPNTPPAAPPAAAPTQPPANNTPNAAPVGPAVSLLDGNEHIVDGHRLVWRGGKSELFTIDGQKFGVGTGTFLAVSSIESMTMRGDVISIKTPVGTKEITKDQLSALAKEALSGARTQHPKTFFSEAYESVTVTLNYTNVIENNGVEQRTPASRAIELIIGK